MKKILSLSLMILIILSLFSSVFASDLKTELQIVKKSSDTKYLENDQGRLVKKITDFDAKKGEATIELKVVNESKEENAYQNTEVMLVIDNSPSMDFVTKSGKTRKDIAIPAAKKLVENLFSKSSTLKMGVVNFSGGYSTSSATELMCALTDKKDDVIKSLNTLISKSTESGTNILAGVTRANNSFSSNCKNKVIVLLTDGVPNYDLNYNYSGNDTTTNTSKKVQDNTKNGLISISKSGAYIISMMTGMSEEDGNKDKNGTVYNVESTVEDDLKAVERIFGTTSNPNVGKYYLVDSTKIDNIINNDIFNDVSEKLQNPITNVKIVDYFPSDIMDNFEFSYVDMPNRGTISDSIDTETNSITWDIGTLKGDKAARLKYKLKIKDMNNTKLLNKTIKTNDKVVLTYQDKDLKDYKVTLSDSPKIKLAEIKQKENKKDNKKDNTTATGKIPYTGASYIIIFAIALILIVGIIAKVKYNDLKGIK